MMDPETLHTPLPSLPASPGGSVYHKVWNPDAGVWAYRARPLALYYRDKHGGIHAYTPGADPNHDAQFRAVARARGLRLVARKERRKMWRDRE